MKTPIFDFVSRYSKSGNARMHMPGHKGVPLLGCEPFDITEISGADSLYEANGIIKESEKNASSLFGCDTYFSTEGSSQCIRAMLYLAIKKRRDKTKRPKILAPRNVHKAFLYAAAMLDFDIEWLYGGSYLSADLPKADVERAIALHSPDALYVTSPDYLGKVCDIAALAEVCHENGVMLLSDNAHGAYLKFLSPSLHPCDCGADICCDSAHKTLPSLTGGAYLHVSNRISHTDKEVKDALALFGSTSPSYLTLASLDLVNKYISDGYEKKLSAFCKRIDSLKDELTAHGYTLFGNEKLKITILAKEYGYLGHDLAKLLFDKGIVCEFCDRDFLTLMLTPECDRDIKHLGDTLLGIEKREKIAEAAPVPSACEKVLDVRKATFADSELVNTEDSIGRVLASPSVGCPPAVPIVMCGERIDENAAKSFRYYGIEKVSVVK